MFTYGPMMKSVLLAGLGLSILCGACGSGTTPESQTPAQPSPTPEPIAKKNETPDEHGGHIANDEPLVALEKPASTWQIGGKSISLASLTEIRDTFTKAGCEPKGDARQGQDLYERLSFSCQPKGAKGPGDVIVVRPSKAPERAKEKAKAPVEMENGDHNPRSSWVYDPEADTYLEVSLLDNGTKQQADKLIKAVLVKAKN